MSEIIALSSLVVALVSAWLSWQATQTADRANSIGNRANDLSQDANRSAEDASAAAIEANRIAGRATVEAQRAADAAEASLALQRDEAAALHADRQSALTANVLPLIWDTRVRAGALQGIQFKNYGPAVARDVTGLFTHGDGCLSVTWPAIAKDELAVRSHGYEPWAVDAGDRPPQVRPEWEVAARALWTNEDGSQGDSGWLVVPRR